MTKLRLALCIRAKCFISLQFLQKGIDMTPLRVLVNVDQMKVKVSNFLYEIGYNFVERLLEEIIKGLVEASDVLVTCDVFDPNNEKRKSCKEQFSVIANHYRNKISDQHNRDTTHSANLISKNYQQARIQYFVPEFNETFEELKTMC